MEGREKGSLSLMTQSWTLNSLRTVAWRHQVDVLQKTGRPVHCLGSLRLVSKATQKAPSRSWVNTPSIPSSAVQASNRCKERKMTWNYSSDCPRSRSLWLQRHDPQHLHPLIQVAMWVGGLRGPLEESVLCLCLSVSLLLHACLSMFTLSVRRHWDA